VVPRSSSGSHPPLSWSSPAELAGASPPCYGRVWLDRCGCLRWAWVHPQVRPNPTAHRRHLPATYFTFGRSNQLCLVLPLLRLYEQRRRGGGVRIANGFFWVQLQNVRLIGIVACGLRVSLDESGGLFLQECVVVRIGPGWAGLLARLCHVGHSCCRADLPGRRP
jgi:hypothetical protein